MAIVTYDVSSKHAEVKRAMRARGYLDSWTSEGQTYYLPNTTLWKPDADAGTARAEIEAVAKQLQVRLERAVAVQHTPWSAIPGIAHAT